MRILTVCGGIVLLGAIIAVDLSMVRRIESLEAELTKTRVAAANGRDDESLAESLSRLGLTVNRMRDDLNRLRDDERATRALVDAHAERLRAQDFLNRSQTEVDGRQSDQLRRLGAR